VTVPNLDFAQLDEFVGRLLTASRIPGVAIAIVADGETIFSRGYGVQDLDARLPMQAATTYPIASTSKAINATLLGMLVDAGQLDWDAPVRRYLPRFEIRRPALADAVTVRDLVLMRTGLPRHDWVRIENPISRAELTEAVAHLELSSGFRERFQYNNITTTIAGHIAEVVTGETWEELVKTRIMDPIGMTSSSFCPPLTRPTTKSYHENSQRELVPAHIFLSDVIGPAGGVIYSTVDDMARWALFNLKLGAIGDTSLINRRTMLEIHTPQMIAGDQQGGLTPNAGYGLGWFIDEYRGFARVSHGGDLHDVNSNIMLFPGTQIGIVSFANFGRPQLSSVINERVFDILTAAPDPKSFEMALAAYETRIEELSARSSEARCIPGTRPSHPLGDYAGVYTHPAYGSFEVIRSADNLHLQRLNTVIPLSHCHFDVWGIAPNDLFAIDYPHAFDRSGRITFTTSSDGIVCSMQIAFEPEVDPISFVKATSAKVCPASG
jgi:CubicO group peptidase (beta-lactamase class C family)